MTEKDRVFGEPLVDHKAAPVVGYADPLIVDPGDSVAIQASAATTDSHGSIAAAAAATATVVRLGHDGTTWTESPIGDSIEVTIPHQRLPLGSWVEFPAVPQGGALSCWLWLGRYPDDSADVITQGDLRLTIDAEGRLGSGEGATDTRSAPLDLNRWYLVAGGKGWVAVKAKRGHTTDPRTLVTGTIDDDGSAGSRLVEVNLGRGLDGRVARPAVHRRLDPALLESLAAKPDETSADVVATWDLASGIPTQSVPGRYPGTMHQGPTRAVPGPGWNGTQNDWRYALEHYDAVHLHTDDLIDARWPTTFTVEAPADLTSGAYAVRIETESGADLVPFFVNPTTRTYSADSAGRIAVLLPTMTYLAYANEQAQPPLEELSNEVAAPFGRHNRLLSWYDRHRDGSRVVFASTRRPLMGVRPDHEFRYLGAAHGLSFDLALLGWLQRRGIDHDIITDHLLDQPSFDLSRYRLVITGGHPEYWTDAMVTTLEDFLDVGGRLAYLGGNGFVWPVAVDRQRPWLAEMRRGQIENVPLDGEGGEDHFQLTGRPAGLCRVVGRSEAALVGVATTAMGFANGVPYRRLPASNDPRVARIFDGVDAEVLGAFGPKGAVVGYETDLANHFLGTPSHALVLATAELPEGYGAFAPGMFPGPSGETAQSRLRADMVFFETAAGGAVFSASTILWSGSLSHNGDDNEVSRMTENLIRWFADPESITPPWAKEPTDHG